MTQPRQRITGTRGNNLPRPCPSERRRHLRQSDQEQSPEHRDEAQRIQPEAPRDAESVDYQSGDRRPDDAGQVEAAGVEGNRRLQILASHEQDDHRLTGRDLDCACDTLYERQHEQQADRRVSLPRQEPEDCGLYQKDRLRNPDHLESI